MKITLMVTLLISLSLVAKENIYTDREKQNQISYKKFNRIRLGASELCSKKCKAITAVKNTKKNIASKVSLGPGGRNPAAALCTAIDADPSIFYYHNGDALTVCIFSDKSYLFAWDLFDKLFKKKM